MSGPKLSRVFLLNHTKVFLGRKEKVKFQAQKVVWSARVHLLDVFLLEVRCKCLERKWSFQMSQKNLPTHTFHLFTGIQCNSIHTIPQYNIFCNFSTKMLPIAIINSMQSIHSVDNRYTTTPSHSLQVSFCYHGFKNKYFATFGIAFFFPDFCHVMRKESDFLNNS